VLAQSYASGQQIAQQRKQQQQMAELRKATANLYKARAKNIEAEGAIEQMLGIAGGQVDPATAQIPPALKSLIPTGRPIAGGGFVGQAQPTTEEQVGDRIFMRDAQGQVVGERLAEVPAAPQIPQALPEVLRKRIGVTEKEAKGAFLKKRFGITTKTTTERQLLKDAQAEAARRIPVWERQTPEGRKKYEALVKELEKEYRRRFGSEAEAIAPVEEQEVDETTDLLDINF
jgi:hypothetical protein